MQRLFGEPTEWHCKSLEDILEPVAAVVAQAPARTVFTRFRTPEALEDAPGQWRQYYRLWACSRAMSTRASSTSCRGWRGSCRPPR
jgi:hypothetical protein